MKRFIFFSFLFILFSCQKPAPKNLGLRQQNGEKTLRECLKNCLTSFKKSTQLENFSEPIKILSNRERAKSKIKSILNKNFTVKLLEEKDDYLRYELSSFLSPGTDVEFWFGKEKLIHFRIASRNGFIAPRPLKIIESIRFKYYQNDF